MRRIGFLVLVALAAVLSGQLDGQGFRGRGRGGQASGGGGGDSPLSQNCWPRLGVSCVEGNPDTVSAFNTRINTGGEWRSDWETFVTTMDGLYASYDPSVDDRARVSLRALAAATLYFGHDTYSGGSAYTKAQWATKAISWLHILRNGEFPASANVASLSRTGSTVTVNTIAAHGLTTGRSAGITGVDQPEYNVGGIITVVDGDTFTYEIVGSPASPTGSSIKFDNIAEGVNTGAGDFHAYVAVAIDLLWPALSDTDKRSFFLGWLMLGENEATVSNVRWGVQTIAETAEQKWNNNHFVESMRSLITTALVFKGSGINEAWCDLVLPWYDTAVRGSSGWMTLNSVRGDMDGSWDYGNVYGLSYDHVVMVGLEMMWRISHGLSRAEWYQTTGAGRQMRGNPILTVSYLMPWGEVNTDGPNGREVRAFGQTHSSWTGDIGFYAQKTATGFAWNAHELDGLDQDRADLSRWLVENITYETNGAYASDWWPTTRFFRAKGTAKSAGTIGLATSRFLADGTLSWRTGYRTGTDFDQAVVLIEAIKWYTTDPSPVGALQINYKGPTVVRPRVGGHDADTSGRYGSANLVGAPDPTRTTLEGNASGQWDDHGYIRNYQPAQIGLTSNTLNDFVDLASVKFLGVGQNDADEKFGYAYIPQDRAYNTDTINDNAITAVTQKWSTLNRQYAVRLPDTPGTDPLKVWVYDRGTTESTAYEKRYTWHIGPAPTVDGSSSAGPSRNGSTTGKTTYTGATVVSWVNSGNGQTNKTYLRWYCPTSTMKVVVVNWRRGATFTDGEDAYGLINSWAPFGLGFTNPGDGGSPSMSYASAYRIEIIPETSNVTDRCMQSFQVFPDTSSASQAVTDITGTGYEGQRVGQDVTVCANANGSPSGSFVLPASVTSARLFLCNLPTSTARTFDLSSGTDITSVTLASNGSNAASGATSNSVGTIELIVTVGSGSSRTFGVN